MLVDLFVECYITLCLDTVVSNWSVALTDSQAMVGYSEQYVSLEMFLNNIRLQALTSMSYRERRCDCWMLLPAEEAVSRYHR